MKREPTDKAGQDLSRRQFIKKTGVAAAAVAAASLGGLPKLTTKARAAGRDYILIGRPNPFTGPLSVFGDNSPWVDDRAIAAMNKDGGFFIEEYGKKLPVKIKIVDTQSDPTKTAEATARLITKDKVDFIIANSSPLTVNPASAICEKYQVPCIAMEVPAEPWLTGGPYKWSYLACFDLESLADLYIELWDSRAAQTNKVVGALWPNDADGISFTEIFTRKLAAKGYKLVDPGRFPFFSKDFSTIINLFKKNKVEILTGALLPPDWTTVWRQCRQMGFAPKFATIGKALLLPGAIEALGSDLGNGLSTECWWSPHHPFYSSLSGETCMDLAEAWTRDTGKEWIQPLGFKYAGFEILANVLKRCMTLDKHKFMKAFGETNMTTMMGPIKYNQRHYAPTPLVGGQWLKGKKFPWNLEVVYNKSYPSIPTTSKMLFPIPGGGRS
jgi:branched-chain amino acid transport system substrate-binding protein